MSNPEHAPQSAENGHESLAGILHERQAEVIRSSERTVEQSPERQAATEALARKEARDAAVSVERPHGEVGHVTSDTHHIRRTATRAARKKAYKDIMSHTQAELPAASRAFSKVIHQPVVEQTSAAVGATIARPNAILFGALFAIIVSGGVYLVARHYGYALSGFEALGSFMVGWIVGVIVDVLRLALGRR